MKKKVLFVCLGNICRSPSAEAVFRGFVEAKGEGSDFIIDSCGTSGWHAGEPADGRMQQHAIKRNYKLTSISRPFDEASDFDNFDMVVAMDQSNLSALKAMARNEQDLSKLFLMTDFSTSFDYDHVPDPYYGGSKGFELVLDLLEDASEGLYKELQK